MSAMALSAAGVGREISAQAGRNGAHTKYAQLMSVALANLTTRLAGGAAMARLVADEDRRAPRLAKAACCLLFVGSWGPLHQYSGLHLRAW